MTMAVRIAARSSSPICLAVETSFEVARKPFERKFRLLAQLYLRANVWAQYQLLAAHDQRRAQMLVFFFPYFGSCSPAATGTLTAAACRQ